MREDLQTSNVNADIEASQTIDNARALSLRIESGIFCGSTCEVDVHTAAATRRFEWTHAPPASLEHSSTAPKPTA